MKRFALIIMTLLGLTSAIGIQIVYGELAAGEHCTKPKEAKGGKAIVVASAHKTFQVTLNANPSTGYRWYLHKYDNSLMEVVSHKFISSRKGQVPGAPGSTVWTFKVKQTARTVPQATHIDFIYLRPWDSVNVKHKNITVVFASADGQEN